MSVAMTHTGFVVKDLDTSLSFYRDALGLDVVREADVSDEGLSKVVGYQDARLKVAMVKGTDGHLLELIQYVNPPVIPRQPEELFERSVSGASHLAFVVDDIDAVFDRLIGIGGRILNPLSVTRTGKKACYMQDPDGNWVELAEA